MADTKTAAKKPVELKAPAGKTRIVAIEGTSKRLVADYDAASDAMRIAKGHNDERRGEGEGYWVFDSAGQCLRNPGSARGVGHE